MQAEESCSPERCGNLTVYSPFSIVSGSSQNRCAQLGFQVHCATDIPYLGYYEPAVGLQILDIFYGNASLLVSDVHKLGDFNPSSYEGCHVPVANTSSKISSPFSISRLNQNLVSSTIFLNRRPKPGFIYKAKWHHTTTSTKVALQASE
jgi:hypothetical protein